MDWKVLGWVVAIVVLAVAWLVKVWCSSDEADPL